MVNVTPKLFFCASGYVWKIKTHNGFLIATQSPKINISVIYGFKKKCALKKIYSVSWLLSNQTLLSKAFLPGLSKEMFKRNLKANVKQRRIWFVILCYDSHPFWCVSINIFLAKTLVYHTLDAWIQVRRGCSHQHGPEIYQTIMSTLCFGQSMHLMNIKICWVTRNHHDIQFQVTKIFVRRNISTNIYNYVYFWTIDLKWVLH